MTGAASVESPADLWTQPPGLKRRYWLRTTSTDAGLPVDVPITVVSGRARGPRLALVAGVHGDEVEGQFALARLAATFELSRLAGTLVMVLCANPLAAQTGQRCTPHDGADLNRVFPGDPTGSLSHRLAAALFDLVRAADFLMTLHSWFSAGEVLPYVEYPLSDGSAADAAVRAARVCGLPRVMPLDWHPGLLPAAAVRSGVPSIEVEIGGLGQVTTKGQALYRRTIQRVLHHIGSLSPAPPTIAPVSTIRAHHMTAPVSGLLYLDVTLGEPIFAGQRMGIVSGLDGHMEAELVAPAGGEIGAVRRFVPVREGDHVAAIFEAID